MSLSPVRKVIKLEVMFFGGAGCNEASRSCKTLDPEKFTNTRLFVANTDHIQLQGHFPRGEGTNLYYDRWSRLMNVVPMNHTGGQGAGHDERIGREAADDQDFCNEVAKSITQSDVGLFVSALGGGTGTYAIIKAAKIAKEINDNLPLKDKKTFIAIVMMSEESGKVKRAADALRELSKIVFTIPIENSKIIPYVESLGETRDLDTNEGYQKIHDLVLKPMIEKLHSIINEHWETTHNDQADLRTSTSKGELGYFGFTRLPADANTPITGGEIGNQLFTGHFQNLDYAKNSVEVTLWKHGWSPILGSKKLEEVIREQTNASGDKEVEMNLGIKLEGVSPEEKWVAVLCVAPHADPQPLSRGDTGVLPASVKPPIIASSVSPRDEFDLGDLGEVQSAGLLESFSPGTPAVQTTRRSGTNLPIEFVINGKFKTCKLDIELSEQYPDLQNLTDEGRQEIFEAIKTVTGEYPDSLRKWDRSVEPFRIVERLRRTLNRG